MEGDQEQIHGHGTCAVTQALLPQLGLKFCSRCLENFSYILNKVFCIFSLHQASGFVGRLEWDNVICGLQFPPWGHISSAWAPYSCLRYFARDGHSKQLVHPDKLCVLLFLNKTF